jgi:hypothetical protein
MTSDNTSAAKRQQQLLLVLNADDPQQARAAAAELGIVIDSEASQELLERSIEDAICANDPIVELSLGDALALAIALKDWNRSQRLDRLRDEATATTGITAAVDAALRRAAKK